MANEHIEIIRNSLVAKYEFPYYALVRVRTRHNGTVHFPAPFFNGPANKPRSYWAGNLPIDTDKRDGEYYECPFCGEKSFFAGICEDCESDFEVWDDEVEQYVNGGYPIEYENHEALKRSVKNEILYRIDHKIEDLGIISAEIVLPVPWGVEWTPSPFLKSEEWSALRSLDRIESVIRTHEILKEKEEYQKMIRDFTPADGVPLDYIEGDEIEVEGTDEKRRYINGMWQHMHGEYEYWHPMARIHKNSHVYPMCIPNEE